MMTEHPNATRVRRVLEAHEAEDYETLTELYDPDIVWTVAGSHRFAGRYEGIDELFDYFRATRKVLDRPLTITPLSVLANDRHCGVFVRVTGERQGRKLDVTMAEAFTVGPNGRFTQFYALSDDQEAVDAFWSPDADDEVAS